MWACRKCDFEFDFWVGVCAYSCHYSSLKNALSVWPWLSLDIHHLTPNQFDFECQCPRYTPDWWACCFPSNVICRSEMFDLNPKIHLIYTTPFVGCGHAKPLMVAGGRAFVWPCIQQSQRISLNTVTLTIDTPNVYTQLGVAISVTGIAQVTY